MKKFALRISQLRSQRGVSQAEAAKLLNLSRSALSMYETGNREPSFETLDRFADFYDVDIGYLIGSVDDPGRYPRHGDEEAIRRLLPYEADLLSAYRKADKATRLAVQRILQITLNDGE